MGSPAAPIGATPSSVRPAAPFWVEPVRAAPAGTESDGTESAAVGIAGPSSAATAPSAPAAIGPAVAGDLGVMGPVMAPAAGAVDVLPETGLMMIVMASHGATPFLLTCYHDISLCIAWQGLVGLIVLSAWRSASAHGLEQHAAPVPEEGPGAAAYVVSAGQRREVRGRPSGAAGA